MQQKMKLPAVVREKVTCVVCFQFMKKPKKLETCNHTICDDCVHQIQRFDELPPPSIRCPFCRQISKQVLDDSQTIQLYKDFEGVIWANTAKDITQLTLTTNNLQCDWCKCSIVTVKCKMCDTYYCAECHTRHSENKLTDEHEYFTAAEINDYFLDKALASLIEMNANGKMIKARLDYMNIQLQPRKGNSETEYNSFLEESVSFYEGLCIAIINLSKQKSFRSMCENMEQLIHFSVTLTKRILQKLQEIDTTFTFEAEK